MLLLVFASCDDKAAVPLSGVAGYPRKENSEGPVLNKERLSRVAPGSRRLGGAWASPRLARIVLLEFSQGPSQRMHQRQLEKLMKCAQDWKFRFPFSRICFPFFPELRNKNKSINIYSIGHDKALVQDLINSEQPAIFSTD